MKKRETFSHSLDTKQLYFADFSEVLTFRKAREAEVLEKSMPGVENGR